MLPDLQVLLAVTSTLEELGVPYVVGGSIASSALGIFRTTNDADIAARFDASHVTEFCRRLSGAFYLDDERIRHAVTRQSQFNIIHLGQGLKVDVYVLSEEPFARQQLLRRRRVRLAADSPAEIFLPSAEDVVLQKLRWFRMGSERSERQWLDVLGVLKVQKPTIDRDYLRSWAEELEVADLLARAFADAGYV